MDNFTSTLWCHGFSDYVLLALRYIKQFMGTEGYIGTLRIVAGLSLLLVIANTRKVGALVLAEWIKKYVIIMACFVSWTMNVYVKDTAKSINLYVGSETGVPAIIALPACILTSLTHHLTSAIESTANMFNFKSSGNWERYGSTFHAKIIENSRAIRPKDLIFVRNFNECINKCVIRETWIGARYTMEDLRASNNLWGLICKAPNQELAMNWYNGKSTDDGGKATGSDYEIIGCDEAIRRLNVDINLKKANWFTRLAKSLFNSPDEGAINQFLAGYLATPTHAELLTSASAAAQDRLNQAMMVNLFKTAVDKNQRSFGLPGVYPETRASLEFVNAGNFKWSMASKYLPIAQQILVILLLMLGPILILTMFFQDQMSKVCLGWLQGVYWLMLWEPCFCMLDIFMETNYSLGEYTINSSMHQLSQAGDIQAMAGTMSIGVATIAWYVAQFGKYAAVSMASQIGGNLSSAIATPAREVTDGNMSLGSVSSNVVNTDLTRSNKHDTSAEVFSGGLTTNRADNTKRIITPEGKMLSIGGPGTSMSQGATQHKYKGVYKALQKKG